VLCCLLLLPEWIWNAARYSTAVMVQTFLLAMLLQSAPAYAENPVQSIVLRAREAARSGRFDQAEQDLQAALKLAETRGAADEMVLVLGDFGVLLTKTQPEEAERHLDRALRIVKSSGHSDDRQLPVILGSLGVLYEQTERYKQSEDFLNDALQLSKKRLGPDHLYIADLESNLAVLYMKTGRANKAEKPLERALALVEKKLGKDHSYTAPILTNLAAAYEMRKDRDRAEPLLARAVRLTEETFGPEHPDLAPMLGNLGLLYYNLGDMARAEPALRRALDLTRKLFGADSIKSALFELSLANTLREQGRLDEAHSLYDHALRIQERDLGPKDSVVAQTLEQFAKLQRRMSNPTLAEQMEFRAKFIQSELRRTVRVNRSEQPQR